MRAIAKLNTKKPHRGRRARSAGQRRTHCDAYRAVRFGQNHYRAQKIAAALTAKGCPSQVISLDNFYKNLDDYLRLADGSKDYENVTALDVEEINRCLNQLIATGEIDLPGI